MRRALTWLSAAALLAALPAAPSEASERIAVGSKNFEESRLLAEMFARLIEARTDLKVDRKFNLAGTEVCFQALREGAIDLYPEYTGTGLVSILHQDPLPGRAETLDRVRGEFLSRWDLWWLSPLGFENSYEIAVPRALAEKDHLRTITDLARVSGDLNAGFGYEFVDRADGLPGLRKTYGLRFRSVKPMQQALKYRAAGAGRIDALDVYTTDGLIVKYDLTVLDDDQSFSPPTRRCRWCGGRPWPRTPRSARSWGSWGGRSTRPPCGSSTTASRRRAIRSSRWLRTSWKRWGW